jgi:hypothetical protein
MIINIDTNLLKYVIVFVIIHYIVSKIDKNNIPGNNPIFFTSIIFSIFYLLDKSSNLLETFVDTVPTTNDLIDNLIIKSQTTPRSIITPTATDLINNLIIAKSATDTPIVTTPVETTPIETTPIETTPIETTPIETTPIVTTPIETTPIVTTPIVTTPIETTPIETTPIETIQPPQKAQINNAVLQSLFTSGNIPKIDDTKNVVAAQESGDMTVAALKNRSDIISDTVKSNNAIGCNCEDIADKAISKFLSNRRLLDNRGMLHYADAYLGDMGYSQLRFENYIPLGSQGNGVYDSWDLSQYAIINSDRWKPTIENTNKCRVDKLNVPQPIDSKAPLNLMNWDYATKVLGPDNINTRYINERLNA